MIRYVINKLKNTTIIDYYLSTVHFFNGTGHSSSQKNKKILNIHMVEINLEKNCTSLRVLYLLMTLMRFEK